MTSVSAKLAKISAGNGRRVRTSWMIAKAATSTSLTIRSGDQPWSDASAKPLASRIKRNAQPMNGRGTRIAQGTTTCGQRAWLATASRRRVSPGSQLRRSAVTMTAQ